MGAESPPSALGARASRSRGVHIWAWQVPTGACTVAQRALASRPDVFLMQRILTKVKIARPLDVSAELRECLCNRSTTTTHHRCSRCTMAPRTGRICYLEGTAERGPRSAEPKERGVRTRKPHPGSLGRVVPGALPARARGGRGGGGMPLVEFVSVASCQLLSRDLINVPPSDASSRASARICRQRGRGEPSCPASCPWAPPT